MSRKLFLPLGEKEKREFRIFWPDDFHITTETRATEMWKVAETLIPFLVRDVSDRAAKRSPRDSPDARARRFPISSRREDWRHHDAEREEMVHVARDAHTLFASPPDRAFATERRLRERLSREKVAQLRKSDGWLEDSQTRAFNLESRSALDLARCIQLVCAWAELYARVCVTRARA